MKYANNKDNATLSAYIYIAYNYKKKTILTIIIDTYN